MWGAWRPRQSPPCPPDVRPAALRRKHEAPHETREPVARGGMDPAQLPCSGRQVLVFASRGRQCRLWAGPSRGCSPPPQGALFTVGSSHHCGIHPCGQVGNLPWLCSLGPAQVPQHVQTQRGLGAGGACRAQKTPIHSQGLAVQSTLERSVCLSPALASGPGEGALGAAPWW